MDGQHYDDVSIPVVRQNGEANILSDRRYCVQYGACATEKVIELLMIGNNGTDIPKYMDLSYMCDGEYVTLFLIYEGNYKFRVTNITGSTKVNQYTTVSGYHLYDEVAYYLLHNMGYQNITDVEPVLNIESDTSKIIGQH